MKDFIKKAMRIKLNEHTNSNIIFSVKIKGRDAGKIYINKSVPELGDDTIEITDLVMNEDYNDLSETLMGVNQIWDALPEVNRVVVAVTSETFLMWEKLGFQRLNNTYWMSMRGH